MDILKFNSVNKNLAAPPKSSNAKVGGSVPLQPVPTESFELSQNQGVKSGADAVTVVDGGQSKAVSSSSMKDKGTASKASKAVAPAQDPSEFLIAGGGISTASASVVGHAHSSAEKKALFSLVKANAGEDAIFPDPNEGYYGLNVFLLEGDNARNASDFAQALSGKPINYDPAQHSVLVTANSFDEPELGLFVVDRKSQNVLLSDIRNTTGLPSDPVAKHFPQVDENDSAFQVVGVLASQGERLGVIAGEQEPDEMDFASWKP